MKSLFLIFVASVLFFDTIGAQDLFISEFTPDGRRSALEIFNPSLDTLHLAGYSIRNSNNGGPFPVNITDSRYYALNGLSLPPLGTWVFANSETPDDVKAAADVVLTDNASVTGDYILHFFYDDAIGIFKNDTMIDIIGKEAVRQVWDVAGVADVTNHSVNGAKTMIRKPYVIKGNPDWDDSRGYVASGGVTMADSAEWLVIDKTYQTLGQHDFDITNMAIIFLEYLGQVMKSGVIEINFGTIHTSESKEVEIIIRNKGDIDLVIDRIESSDTLFSLSVDSLTIPATQADTLVILFSPVEPVTAAASISLSSNSIVNNPFIFSLRGGGTEINPTDTTHFYVSPSGDDTNTGSDPSEPLKSIAEAIRRIREMNRPAQPQIPQVPEPTTNPILGTPDNYREIILANLENLVYPVMVHLMHGFHFLDQPVEIDKNTGGNIHFVGDWSEDASDNLKSLLDANATDPLWLDLPADKVPVISGGRLITGWTTTSVNGMTAWVADLPDVATGDWYFKQLFVNGRRATRSRYPKEGFFRITEILPASTGATDGKTDRVRVRAGDMQPWKNLRDVEMVHFHRWVDERMPVVSFDPGTSIVELGYISWADMNGSHPVHGAGLSAFHCEHIFETMSEAGEWYLDRPEGKLYYIPLEGETPGTTEVIAPEMLSLFRVTGTATSNDYIWHVTFSRIGFMHTESLIEDHIGTGNGGNYGDPAIFFINARVPVVKACYFAHLCEPGIGFGDGTMGGEIAANLFRDLGSGAMAIYHGTTSTDHTRKTGYNHNHDNDILGYGRFYQGEVAMRYSNNVHLLAEHNHIRDGYYNALTLGCSKTAVLSLGYKNTIRKNHIHTIGQGILSDMGGIYPNGYQPYLLIENNLIHDINARDYTGAAIYFDDNSAHYTARNNVLYGSNLDLINMKGHSILFENNILAFGALDLLYRHKSYSDLTDDVLDLGIRAPDVKKNIFIQNGGQRMFRAVESDPDIQYHIVSDNNIYWNYSVPVQMNEDQDFAQWQAASGDDAHSLVTDPLLEDPLNGDFRMTAGSPARSLGFQEIDISDVGPRISVWEQAGAVWIDYPEPSVKTGFLPSDVAGLHMWISAKYLEDGKISQWDDRTSNRFSLYQADLPLQPDLLPGVLNGYPVVHFDGSSWMGSSHKSLEVQGLFGKFDLQDFSIFTVHRSAGDSQVVIGKGDDGTGGNWSIGEKQNRFRWTADDYIGKDGSGFDLRSYRKIAGQFEYLLNGILDTISSSNVMIDFNQDWIHFFLGRKGGDEPSYLSGDIAEILVYRGAVSGEEMQKIWEYLRTEWGFEEPDAVHDTETAALALYPIPAGDFLIIDNIIGGKQLILSNISGQPLKRIDQQSGRMIRIDVSDLKPGMYFISVFGTAAGRSECKFVKY